MELHTNQSTPFTYTGKRKWVQLHGKDWTFFTFCHPSVYGDWMTERTTEKSALAWPIRKVVYLPPPPWQTVNPALQHGDQGIGEGAERFRDWKGLQRARCKPILYFCPSPPTRNNKPSSYYLLHVSGLCFTGVRQVDIWCMWTCSQWNLLQI